MPGRQLPGLAEQAVDHIAHRAVATVDDDQIHAVLDCGLGDFAPVAAVTGVLDSQFEAAFQCVGQQIAAGRRRRRRGRIDDQHGAHDVKAYGSGDDAGRGTGRWLR